MRPTTKDLGIIYELKLSKLDKIFLEVMKNGGKIILDKVFKPNIWGIKSIEAIYYDSRLPDYHTDEEWNQHCVDIRQAIDSVTERFYVERIYYDPQSSMIGIMIFLDENDNDVKTKHVRQREWNELYRILVMK